MTEVTTERPVDRPTRVMIVDDQALVRAGFRMVLDAEPDIDVVAECADGLAALDALPGRDVDVVLMDIRMPRLDGIEATRRVVERGDTPKVLVLTTFDLDEYVYAALRAGAAGFLLKDAGPSEPARRSGPCTPATPSSPPGRPDACSTASSPCSRTPHSPPASSGSTSSPSASARCSRPWAGA